MKLTTLKQHKKIETLATLSFGHSF